MSFTGFLDSTWDTLLEELFPNESKEYVERLSRIASCLNAGSITEKLQTAAALLESTPIVLTEQISGAGGNFVFDVVAGRHGTIATAVDGATIDGASTISVEYSLVDAPAAADWKVYVDGSFTGSEVDKVIHFVGVKNRVVWTPNAGETLNIIVAL